MLSFDSAAEDCETLSMSRRTIYLSAIERHVSLDVYAAEPAMTDAAFIAAAPRRGSPRLSRHDRAPLA
jgi:hypothetical protein